MEFVKGRVLDIGCGAGRHSLYLQKKGFDVLGIDSSPLAIKVCKLRGLEKAKVMAIEDINFKPDSFDRIIMMGNNFGLFGSFNRGTHDYGLPESTVLSNMEKRLKELRKQETTLF